MSSTAIPENLPPLTPETYFNRELSWIEFNKRVLEVARDERIPLLERIKFLAIVSSNTDEFFMVRVAALHKKAQLGISGTRPDGIPNTVLLNEIRNRITSLMVDQRELMVVLLERLQEEGVVIYHDAEMPAIWKVGTRAYFSEEIYPVLTPLAVDHARPFPFISNLSLNLAVSLKHEDDDEIEFVRLKIPDTLPRLINLKYVLDKYTNQDEQLGENAFVWIEDIISSNLDILFPGMTVIEHAPFRVTRNADIDYEHEEEEEDSTDISHMIEESLRERRFGQVVRLAVQNSISPDLLDPMIAQLNIDPKRDVYKVNGALGGSSLMQLLAVDRPDLKYSPFVPRQYPELSEGSNIFHAIRNRDYLLHHPYDSFAPVENFFRQAAHDPDVLAIKVTLYRVGRNSSIVQSLMEARDNGKQVAVLVELKARFDEENNLEWARAMDDKGVHVTYGVEEMPVKTHAKIAMVIRRDDDGVRRYVHLGTGNYNSSTARLYTDIGLLTCNREIGEDATRLFNRLTGFAPATTYNRLLVAPEYLLDSLVNLIDNEIQAARDGKPARLIFKMNQLEEDLIIRKLYEASQAGVQIDLIVRGLCCLVPGLEGVSENIRVRSIVGRYLEHTRIFYFQNAPEDKNVYLGSADLMRRNLYNRVEVVFPLLDARVKRNMMRILLTSLYANVDVWTLDSTGIYTRMPEPPENEVINSQIAFMHDSYGLEITE